LTPLHLRDAAMADRCPAMTTGTREAVWRFAR
jgi:hypothetical protein